MSAPSTSLCVESMCVESKSMAGAHLLDEGVAAVGTHALGAEVGVAAGAVPVAGHGLRVERDSHAVVLAHLRERRPR
jgi:hypothetical protein